MAKINLSQPIQDEAGHPCEWLETKSEGWPQFGLTANGMKARHHLHRLDLSDTTFAEAVAAHLYVDDEGFDTRGRQVSNVN